MPVDEEAGTLIDEAAAVADELDAMVSWVRFGFLG